MKVYINSSCDIQYSSFYIHGLYEVYGKKNVKFSSQHFKTFKHNNHFLAFVISNHTSQKKFIIDFTDSSLIDKKALKWCDVYGKINLEESISQDPKTIAIGPGFGIRIYSWFETYWYAIINLCKSYKQIPNKRKFLSDYKAQYQRPKLSDYRYQKPTDNYVFFMASLWKHGSSVNTFRANFIESCKANFDITFEGGFAPRTNNDMRGFEAYTAKSRIDIKDYLNKTAKSLVVFNTPAVKNCHGWKLAEYLCLGKAILSTPLSRQMPAVLQDKTDILFTDGSNDDIANKVNELRVNKVLKQELETQAKIYFDTHLSPDKVIKRMVDKKT